MRVQNLTIGAIGLLLAVVPAGAHHSFAAEYDNKQPVKLTGAVTRVRFPNDTIPSSRFDKIGAAMAGLYPLPQTSALVNNYTTTPIKRSSQHRADARVDHQVSAKNMLFFRYSIDRVDILMPNTFDSVIGGNENSTVPCSASRPSWYGLPNGWPLREAMRSSECTMCSASSGSSVRGSSKRPPP